MVLVTDMAASMEEESGRAAQGPFEEPVNVRGWEMSSGKTDAPI